MQVPRLHHDAVATLQGDLFTVDPEDRLTSHAVEDLKAVFMGMGHGGVAQPKHNMAQMSDAGGRLAREDMLFYARRMGHRGFQCIFKPEVSHGLEFIMDEEC